VLGGGGEKEEEKVRMLPWLYRDLIPSVPRNT
jgi:hypothetical protein